MDYDNTAAVDFFLSAVRNHRATTVQEMVNLYETEMDQRRMEAGQQEMLNQQRIGNMLQTATSLFRGRFSTRPSRSTRTLQARAGTSIGSRAMCSANATDCNRPI